MNGTDLDQAQFRENLSGLRIEYLSRLVGLSFCMTMLLFNFNYLLFTKGGLPSQPLDQKQDLRRIGITERRIIPQRLITRAVENGDNCIHQRF